MSVLMECSSYLVSAETICVYYRGSWRACGSGRRLALGSDFRSSIIGFDWFSLFLD